MLPNQMFNAVLSSLRTFDPLSDTLDILIISFVFYQLLQFARKSRAGQLVKGIILILVFYGLAVMLNLKTVTWVLNNVITIGFMAAVVIFQPEHCSRKITKCMMVQILHMAVLAEYSSLLFVQMPQPPHTVAVSS